MEQAMDALKRMGKVRIGKKGDVHFAEGVNLMVRCTQCGMTMPVMSAYVSKSGETYCGNCAMSIEPMETKKKKLKKVM